MNNNLIERRNELLEELAEINKQIASNVATLKQDLCDKIASAQSCADAKKYCAALRCHCSDDKEFSIVIYKHIYAYNHILSLSIHAEDATVEFSRFFNAIERKVPEDIYFHRV